MNIWHDAPVGSVKKDLFDAFIEIPKGCKVKYELDKSTGCCVLTEFYIPLRYIPVTTV